jgi:hypothetical protein
MTANLAIQCDCPNTGKTGSFGFTGGNHRVKNTRVTPVFDCVSKAIAWLKARGWKESLGCIFTAPEVMGILALEVTGADRTVVFDPNGLIEQAFEKPEARIPLGGPSTEPSELSGKPSYRYKTDQVTLQLTEDEIYRLSRRSLKPKEVLALLKSHGEFHEIHDDFYDPETGHAFQPH